jgi:pimeloyl-ACP methyl ester carboxylesterase
LIDSNCTGIEPERDQESLFEAKTIDCLIDLIYGLIPVSMTGTGLPGYRDNKWWKVGNDNTISLEANGKSLEGAWFGRDHADQPTIVMLHEGLGSLGLWRDFPHRLAKATGHAVFAYSRAGYGNSQQADLPRPTDFMSDEAMNSLPDVLDEIGFERGILLGHSDGASIAAVYTGSHDDPRIQGLCLMAPHFFTEPLTISSIAAVRQAWRKSGLRDKFAGYHKSPEHTFLGWTDVWLNDDFPGWNIEAVIPGIRVPVLVIQGEDDQYGTLAQIESLQKNLKSPLDTEILKECRHAPQFEQPEVTLRLITEFIARVSN